MKPPITCSYLPVGTYFSTKSLLSDYGSTQELAALIPCGCLSAAQPAVQPLTCKEDFVGFLLTRRERISGFGEHEQTDLLQSSTIHFVSRHLFIDTVENQAVQVAPLPTQFCLCAASGPMTERRVIAPNSIGNASPEVPFPALI